MYSSEYSYYGDEVQIQWKYEILRRRMTMDDC